MKLLQNIMTFVFLLLFFVSCSKEFVYESEDVDPKIVVNSLVNNTNNMEVTVTKTLSISGESTIEELETAQASIYKNEDYVEDLVYSKTEDDAIGKFSTSFIPEVTSDYRIEVSHPDIDDVQAIAQVPEGAVINDPTVRFVGGNSFNFSFTFDDPSEASYYYLKMYFRGYVIDSITQEKTYVIKERVEIPVTSVPDGQRYLDNGYIFKDETFGGNKVTMAGVAKYSRIPEDIQGGPGIPSQYSYDNVKTDSTILFIYLETLSEDAYKYYKSHANYLNLFVVDVFGEATSLYGNVENGYGIFAGVYVSEEGVEVEN